MRKPKPVVTVNANAPDAPRGAEAIAEAEPVVDIGGRNVKVSRRLLPRTYPRIYRVKAVISPTTYALEDAVSPDTILPFAPTQHVSRLVRMAETWLSNPFI